MVSKFNKEKPLKLLRTNQVRLTTETISNFDMRSSIKFKLLQEYKARITWSIIKMPLWPKATLETLVQSKLLLTLALVTYPTTIIGTTQVTKAWKISLTMPQPMEKLVPLKLLIKCLGALDLVWIQLWTLISLCLKVSQDSPILVALWTSQSIWI